MRTGVCLYGAYEDGFGMSLGHSVRAEGPFKMKYGASTLNSWSGTPILNNRNLILGVHTDGKGSYNCGTAVPQIMIKETDYFGSMFEKVERSHMQDYEESSFVMEDKFYKLLHRGKAFTTEESDYAAAKLQTNDWGQLMDYLDSQDDMDSLETLKIVVCPYCQEAQPRNRKCRKCRFLLKQKDVEKIKEVKQLLKPVEQLFPDLPCYESVKSELKADTFVKDANNVAFLLNGHSKTCEQEWNEPTTDRQYQLLWKVVDNLSKDVKSLTENLQKIHTAKETTLKAKGPQGQACGQTVSTGLNQQNSVKVVKSLDSQNAASQIVNQPRKAKRSRNSKKSTQKESATDGPKGVPKLNNKASNSNVIGL